MNMMKAMKRTAGIAAAPLLFLFLCASSSNGQSLLSNIEQEIEDIVKQTEPAVVTILAQIPVNRDNNRKSLLSFFSSKQSTNKENHYTHVGTGLYLNPQGFVATRGSVVADAEDVRVRLWNEEETHAEVIGIDSDRGLALLRIDSPVLPQFPFARPASIRPGSWVLVIGNSLGVSPSVSMGNVSAIHRDGFFQVAANVDPGANGAPVLSADGFIIGIVSGRIAYSKEDDMLPASNQTLVMPIDHIYRTAHDLLDQYWQKHGWIGITVHRGPYSALTPQIRAIEPGSPAQKAGLSVGDVILKCDNKELASYYSLKKIVKEAKPGDTIRLHVLRDQQELDIELKVGRHKFVNVFETVPYAETVQTTTGEKGAEFDINGKSRLLLEQRLRQMEQEIKFLKESLSKKRLY